MHLAHLATSLGGSTTRVARILASASLSMLLISCGGGGGSSGAVTPPPVTYTAKSGVAQKGPLIKGSTVTAQELDSSLSPTGKQYSYQTISDFGTFSPTNTFTSQYVGVNATGYYFDEVANAVSTGPITLYGYSDLATDTVLNVNLLTTLEYQRIQNLVTKSNMTFGAARTQAEGEVLAALNIPTGSYGAFGTLDLSGSSDGDHILAAISSIFVYGNSAGPLSQLIDNFQSDIGANGVITNAKTTAALAAAAAGINPASVAAHLTQEYISEGLTFTASDISGWIAQSGDGVIGRFAFQVADATPSSVFSFPSFVVSQFAGTSVTVSAGQLSVNGTLASGSVTFKAGDVVTLSPNAGDFPNGVLNCYLVSGAKKRARVSFVSGLLSIAVTPDASSVPLGLTEQFTATGTFSDNSTANLTSSVSWTSDTPTVATVATSSGLADTLAMGSTVVTATSGSVSGSTTLTVAAVALESISITPNPVTIGVGINQPLIAYGHYSDGTTQNVTSVANWTSGTPSIATIGPTTGVATGVSTGSATISATVGSIIGTAPLSVITNSWISTGQLMAARELHTETLLPNGTVLAVGGFITSNDNQVSLASAEVYDPAAGTWSATGSLTTARYGHTATLLTNGTLLVVGGYGPVAGAEGGITGQGVLASAEIYNPSTGTWTTTGSMTSPRYYHSATLLPNGMVLVAGGNGLGPTLNSAEIYDPVAGTWTLTGTMTTTRMAHTATLLPNGTVLVAGGSSAGTVDSVLASAEIYDPSAGTWAATGTMTTARMYHTVTLLQNGTVLAAAGLNLAGASAISLANAEIYDPVAGTWTVTGSLSSARTNNTATLLSNGTVLVTGGYNSGSNAVLANSEIYDPVAGTWGVTGSMITARFYHTAAMLPNGTVLVAGGTTIPSSSSALASAEIYDDLL
jgi:N-acetylneuraminic acid mutarotase